MRILVDTHIFLWFLAGEKLVSTKARSFLEDTRTNEFFVSDATAWEASIKYGLGKLHLPDMPETFFPDRIRKSGYRHLPIDLGHVTRVHSLPKIHSDPFDRLLISQALVETITIITDDPFIPRYNVETLTIRDIS